MKIKRKQQIILIVVIIVLVIAITAVTVTMIKSKSKETLAKNITELYENEENVLIVDMGQNTEENEITDEFLNEETENTVDNKVEKNNNKTVSTKKYKIDVNCEQNVVNIYEKDENGDFAFGDMNIVNHLFNIKALDIIDSRPLPYHTAVKNCKFKNEDDNVVQEPIYKFEKFIFDGFVFFDDMTLLRVAREKEFAPIKNATGNDSPETAKKMYEDYIKTLKK